MRKDRLLKLADFLETVPRKAFDLGTWVASRATRPEGRRPGDCGFAGCAVGWAAHANLFPGFTLRNGFLPVYKDAFDWDAVENVFEIDFQGADFLFADHAYSIPSPTPKQVAKRIRKFVESGGKVPA